MYASPTAHRVCSISNVVGHRPEDIVALRLVPDPMRPANPKKIGVQRRTHGPLINTDHQSHRWAKSEVRLCGDDSRPSRNEVATLACHILDAVDDCVVM